MLPLTARLINLLRYVDYSSRTKLLILLTA